MKYEANRSTCGINGVSQAVPYRKASIIKFLVCLVTTNFVEAFDDSNAKILSCFVIVTVDAAVRG
jgi:hypothetical protein